METNWFMLFGACIGIAFAQRPASEMGAGMLGGMGSSPMNPLLMAMLLNRSPPDVPDIPIRQRLPSASQPGAGVQGVPSGGMPGGNMGSLNNPLARALLANNLLATRLQMLLFADAMNTEPQWNTKTPTSDKARLDALSGVPNKVNGVIVPSNIKAGSDTIRSTMSDSVAISEAMSELSEKNTPKEAGVYPLSKKTIQLEPGNVNALSAAALGTSQTMSATKDTLPQTQSKNVKQSTVTVLEQPAVNILSQQDLVGHETVPNVPTNLISNNPFSTLLKSSRRNQQPPTSPLLLAQLLRNSGQQQRGVPNMNRNRMGNNMNNMMMRGSTGSFMSDYLDQQIDLMTEMGGLGMGLGGMGMMGGGGMGLGMGMPGGGMGGLTGFGLF